MKYKVGDKVNVRGDLKINQAYGGMWFVRYMDEYLGKEMTIEEARSQYGVEYYILKEDEDKWYWTKEMLSK